MTSNVKEFVKLLDELKSLRVSQLRNKLNYDPSRHNSFKDSGNSRGCGCAYCVMLNEYVSAKKSLHRSLKKFDMLYEVWEKPDENTQKRITELEQLVKQLKIKKDRLDEEIKKLQF